MNELDEALLKNITEGWDKGYTAGFNHALDEAVKVALDFHESHGGRSNTAHIVANKIKELKHE